MAFKEKKEQRTTANAPVAVDIKTDLGEQFSLWALWAKEILP